MGGGEGEKRRRDKTDFCQLILSTRGCDTDNHLQCVDDELGSKWSTLRNFAKDESVLGS